MKKTPYGETMNIPEYHIQLGDRVIIEISKEPRNYIEAQVMHDSDDKPYLRVRTCGGMSIEPEGYNCAAVRS